MKFFKFKKLIVKAVFVLMMVCFPSGSFINNVSAGSIFSCMSDLGIGFSPREDADGYLVFDSQYDLRAFFVRGFNQWQSTGSDFNHLQGPCKIRYIGDVPEHSFDAACCFSAIDFDLVNTTTIGDSAFAGLDRLNHCNLPEGLKNIGFQAFKSTGLSENLILPNSLENLGDSAFAGTHISGNLILPASLKKLGHTAFAGTDLESATISGTNLEVLYARGLFSGCSKLRHIKVGQGVKEIRRYVFADALADGNTPRMNNSITLEIPDSVESIDDTFCICKDGRNHCIKTIIWNGQEFSNCNDMGGRTYCQENLKNFLDAFEAKPGNHVERHTTRGENLGNRAPIMYEMLDARACRKRMSQRKIKPRAVIKYTRVTYCGSRKDAFHGEYYYVQDRVTGKTYDNVNAAMAAGIDMSFVYRCTPESDNSDDEYYIDSFAEVMKRLKNIPSRDIANSRH